MTEGGWCLTHAGIFIQDFSSALKTYCLHICPMCSHSGNPYSARTSFTSLVRPAILSARSRLIVSRTYISRIKSSQAAVGWRGDLYVMFHIESTVKDA